MLCMFFGVFFMDRIFVARKNSQKNSKESKKKTLTMYNTKYIKYHRTPNLYTGMYKRNFTLLKLSSHDTVKAVHFFTD